MKRVTMTLEELCAHFPSLAGDRRLLRNDVYAVLLAGIISGDLAPGERLKDAELTATLRVSRTPVREAMSRLQQIGLIRTAPNRYTLVAPIDDDEIADVIGVLQLLLPTAIRQAIQGIDVDTELELAAVVELLEHQVELDPSDALQRITNAILGVVRDRVLVESIQFLLPRFVRYFVLSSLVPEPESRERMIGFSRAILDRDERAITQMDDLLRSVMDSVRENVSEVS